MYYTEFLILFGLILVSAFFSACEIALISLSKSKVDELVTNKVSNSRLLQKLKGDPHKLLVTILIGNNVINIAASAYATVLFSEIFKSNAVGYATGIMTLVILIFGEITPKAFAHQHAVGFSLLVAKPVYLIQLIFMPLVWIFVKIVDLVNYLMGSKKGYEVTEGELVALLKIGAQQGTIESHEREFIENVLEFNDISVEDVMTPRVDIDGLDSEMTIQEAVDFVIKHSHTRLPVYEGNIDNIIGIITIKELLKYFDQFSATKKLKKLKLTRPLEVPYSKKINKLFREFQRKHSHIAIVIDEHGGTAGLVTLEDLLEEIVGEIEDEFDIPENPLEIVDDNTIIANGSILIEDVNDFFKIKFANDERSMISSMIVEHLHRFPREGETIRFKNGRILILKMRKNVVERVKITKYKKAGGTID